MTNNTITHLATVALQGYQWLYNGDRFQTGAIEMAYREDLKVGEILRVGNFTCYIEGWEHSATIGGAGEIIMRTIVTYSRGLIGEAFRTYSGRGEIPT